MLGKLGVMSWGKGLINIGLEGRRNEEEEVKRREVAVFNFQSLFPRLRRGEPEPMGARRFSPEVRLPDT